MLFFLTFFSLKNSGGKCMGISTKILSSSNVFNCDHNKRFLEHQLNILELFLVDHVE